MDFSAQMEFQHPLGATAISEVLITNGAIKCPPILDYSIEFVRLGVHMPGPALLLDCDITNITMHGSFGLRDVGLTIVLRLLLSATQHALVLLHVDLALANNSTQLARGSFDVVL